MSSVIRLTRQGAVGEVCHVLDLSGLPDTRQNRKRFTVNSRRAFLDFRQIFLAHTKQTKSIRNSRRQRLEEGHAVLRVKRPALRERVFVFVFVCFSFVCVALNVRC